MLYVPVSVGDSDGARGEVRDMRGGGGGGMREHRRVFWRWVVLA